MNSTTGSQSAEMEKRRPRVGGCEYSSLETAALFADGLGEKILVTLGEARRAGRLAIDCTRPARAVWEYAVGVKLGGDGGAGNGENVA